MTNDFSNYIHSLIFFTNVHSDIGSFTRSSGVSLLGTQFSHKEVFMDHLRMFDSKADDDS